MFGSGRGAKWEFGLDSGCVVGLALEGLFGVVEVRSEAKSGIFIFRRAGDFREIPGIPGRRKRILILR